MWSHDQSLCHRHVGYYFIVPAKFGSHKVSFFETLVWKLISQSETVITKWDKKQLLKSYYKVRQKFITEYVRFYKVWQTVITKWDVTVLVKGEFIRIFQLIKELNSMISNHHNKLQFKKLKFIDCHYILFRA